jgi:hypothetical protein
MPYAVKQENHLMTPVGVSENQGLKKKPLCRGFSL